MNNTFKNELIEQIFPHGFNLYIHDAASGEFNMNFDLEEKQKIDENNKVGFFRVYAWQPHCVSLGYNQNADQISQELCVANNFDLVRRPTGGRAVLHAKEITYSMGVYLEDKLSIHTVYKNVHILLLEIFKSLGVELSFEKAQADFNKIYRQDISVSCFASSARYEIIHGSQKVVGSAQRLFGNTLLQHGSILLESGYEQLANVVNTQSEESREKLREFIRAHSISLSEIANREITYLEAKNAFENYLKS
jgi:lipoate-protein ligase A